MNQSLLLITKNNKRSTQLSLRSLEATVNLSTSIAVWDEASKDNTPVWLKELEKDCNCKRALAVIDSKIEVGYEKAVEEMFRFFPATFLVVCRSDAYWKQRNWNGILEKLYCQCVPYGIAVATWQDFFMPQGKVFNLADNEKREVVELDYTINSLDYPAFMISKLVFDELYDIKKSDGLGFGRYIGEKMAKLGRGSYKFWNIFAQRIDEEKFSIE